MTKTPKFKIGDKVYRIYYDGNGFDQQEVKMIRAANNGNFYYGFEGGEGSYDIQTANQSEEKLFATKEELKGHMLKAIENLP